MLLRSPPLTPLSCRERRNMTGAEVRRPSRRTSAPEKDPPPRAGAGRERRSLVRDASCCCVEKPSHLVFTSDLTAKQQKAILVNEPFIHWENTAMPPTASLGQPAHQT